MDVTGDNACMTQRWHGNEDMPNRALDWQSACGENTSKQVRFRGWTSALDHTSPGVRARGVPEQLAPLACAGTTNRYARVRIRSTYDTTVVAAMFYQHMTISSTAVFDIPFPAGDGKQFFSQSVGDTIKDGPDACWTGWHVHENNSNSSLWDSHQVTYYNNLPVNSDTIRNNDFSNWSRRLAWERPG